MISVNLGQGTSLPGRTTVLCLLVGATTACLWFRFPLARSKRALSPAKPTSDSSATPSTRRGVRLCQVNPDKNEADTDIDIIAIHGLDTKSPDTWTWVDPGEPDNPVNWLADPNMLPSQVGAARIFTCDWPADLLLPSDLVQKTIDEYALLLLDGIHRELFVTNAARREGRPIFFIASCLGGIVLAKALVDAGEKYLSLRRATRGFVFLATPFRGTSFRDVAALAEPGLTVWAWFRGREANTLLDKVKGSTFDLETLVREFTQLCLDKDHPCLVFTFYEKGKTSLPLKILPWVPGWLRQEKQLVDEASATLDIVPKPLPLDRRHVLTNKFGSPECADYKKVAGKVQKLLEEIRKGTILAQADAWIRNKHYTAEKLKIERLSGEDLSMDQCYVNLAIIERPGGILGHSSKGDSTTQSSPFSRSARLKVETLNKNIQVELPALFDPRKKGDVETKPRRILIRGRAGVGKTTLCKKIVYEFTRGTWSGWSELFDRVLWVPLRHLKLDERLQKPGYNFFQLFSHEYFSQAKGGENLAKALFDASDTTKSSRTLFLLDGLDEVSKDLSGEGDMFRFLKELLNQPNVIITSRPSAELPARVHAIDIELETIGFTPDQVDEYLERTFSKQSNEVRTFLQNHLLVQDLVRIPIQLDALCFTWNKGFTGSSGKFDTMTTIYQAIEHSLWMKDILRLKKSRYGKRVTESEIQDPDFEIQDLVKDEIIFLEGFAFTGLHNDVIDFKQTHRRLIYTHFTLPSTTFSLDRTAPRLSFLRTSDHSSDHSSEQRHRSYHFLHLTYQEYFAARYFVRQWKAEERLKCLVLSNGEHQDIETSNFLGKHKYTARYDVFWRFVAGLFDAEGKGEEFFKAIEDNPRDLLGPTHQRLVMHCLSEASTEMPLRRSLENKLKDWLLFECKFTEQARLASEVEFPEQVLIDAMQEESDVKMTILGSLANRPTLPSSIVNMILSWLAEGKSNVLKMEVLQILQRSRVVRGLSDNLLMAVVALALCKDEDTFVREAALWILRAQPSISDKHLTVVVALALCKDENKNFRLIALSVLGARPSISDERLTAVVPLLQDEDKSVRQAALKVLQAQPSISDEHLTAVVLLLQDEDKSVRQAALKVLQAQPSISDERLTAVVPLLQDEDWPVREAALEVLQAQTSISDERLIAVVALLEDEEWSVRHTALEVLQAQPSISYERLTAVVARLGDRNKYVRRAALEVLREQSSVSDKRLTAVVALLEDEERSVRHTALKVLQAQPSISDELLTTVSLLLESERADSLAEAVLRGHKEFYSTLLSGPYVGSLLKIFLRRSFEEQWSWYVEDGASCVNAPDGVGIASIDDMDGFMDMVMKSRPPGIPSMAVEM